VQFEYLPGETGSFKLIFCFTENNPYLETNVISKTYHLRTDEKVGDVICSTIESTELEWKEGKDLIKKAKGGLGEEKGTFFHFFNPPNIPEGESPSAEVEGRMGMDFEMAVELRDKIIPHAVAWYTGEAREDDDDDALQQFMQSGHYGDEDDEDAENDEDDEDDDDEEDDEDFAPPPQKGKRYHPTATGQKPTGKRTQAATTNTSGKGDKSGGSNKPNNKPDSAEKPPECKQQ